MSREGLFEVIAEVLKAYEAVERRRRESGVAPPSDLTAEGSEERALDAAIRALRGWIW